MTWTLARARGYLVFSCLLVMAGVISWSGAAVRVDIPLADGPRVVRQYVVAFLPALIAPVLIDRLPDVSATLVRSSVLRCSDLTAYWSGLGLVLVPSWRGVAPQTAHYEALVATVVAAGVLVIAHRWGVSGSLVAAILGMVWVLAGGTIATAMGFPGVAMDPWAPQMSPAPYVSCETAAVSLGALGATVFFARG